MKISLLSADAIRLEPQAGMLTVEAADGDMQYSPFHMLASGLATCSYAVLASWAANVGLEVADLSIEVRWTFADEPHRVGRIAVGLEWPSLPASRLAVAKRAASLCAIHGTLTHPPHIEIEVRQ